MKESWIGEKLQMISARHRVAIVAVVCVFSFLTTFVSLPDNVLATDHGGWITQDETWDKIGNDHYIVKDVRVMPSVTLTITQGANVSFYPGTSLYVDGDLIVSGTVSEPVTFTSFAFDPQPGDWGSIHFNATAGSQPPSSQIRSATVEYGSTAIYANNRTLAIYSSTIRYNLLGIDSYYAAVMVDMNSIHNNDNDGVNWTGLFPSYPSSISVNNITNNGGNGISGSAGALVSITSNSISFNKYGIHFVDSTPATSHNNIKNNSEDGIYFLRSGNGTFISNNTIANNSKNGIWVNTSTVLIDNNTVDHNGLNGTYVTNYKGTFENNTVLDNSGNGIEAHDSVLHIQNNTFSSNGNEGLYAQKCECQISYNSISYNTGGGVYLQYSSNSTLYHNNISWGGFEIYNSANSIISRNEFWQTGGSLLYESFNTIISNNTLFGGGVAAINSDNISAWTNSIESPFFWGFRFDRGSNISLGDNIILRSFGGPGGIGFLFNRNITAINNTVLQRWGQGLSVQFSENVTLQKNNISSTGEGYCIGILLDHSTNVNITNNNTISNHDVGIQVVVGGVDIVIYDNTTTSDNDIGILCQHSSSIILNNTIIDNEIGVRTEAGSTPQIRGNNIEGNADYGVENADSSVTVDAIRNWWGAADGPGAPGGPGKGDPISYHVGFTPWLTQTAF